MTNGKDTFVETFISFFAAPYESNNDVKLSE